MTDEDINLERLLQLPPEEVFAMFLNDLTQSVYPMEAALEILAEPESQKEHERVLRAFEKQVKNIRTVMDLAWMYLSKCEFIDKSGNDET